MHGKIQKNVSYCMELKVITTKNLLMEQCFLDMQVCFQTAVLRLRVQKSQKNVNTLLVHLMDVYVSLYERNGISTSLSFILERI